MFTRNAKNTCHHSEIVNSCHTHREKIIYCIAYKPLLTFSMNSDFLCLILDLKYMSADSCRCIFYSEKAVCYNLEECLTKNKRYIDRQCQSIYHGDNFANLKKEFNAIVDRVLTECEEYGLHVE